MDMSKMLAPILTWGTDKKYKKIEAFLLRPSVEDKAMQVAAAVLADIRVRGDKAVIECAQRFDGSTISTRRMQVTPAEISEANNLVDAEFKAAAQEAHKRIVAFSKNGMRADWEMATPKGGTLGEKFVP